MTQITVGVRELKAQLSHYLRQVAAGHTIVITDRGQPIGQIVPPNTSAEDHVRLLVAAGLVAWIGQPLEPTPPTATSQGDTTVADLLLEDRE